jgi:ABC-2 type transport system ATP-binding protein
MNWHLPSENIKNMLEIKNLQKKYSGRTVLSIESLTVNPQELVGLVGNNGAGKTTFLSLILDLIKATSGYVNSKDQNVYQSDHWKSYTGAYLGENFLIPFLSPIEFLKYIGKLHGKTQSDLDQFLTENAGFFSDGLEGKTYIRNLSLGNKNKTGILASIFTSPEVLILDEPFANLDPGSQSWLKRKLTELNKEGVTILLSSHDLKHVTDICSRILLLDKGEIKNDIPCHENSLQELESYFNVY